MLLFVGKVTAWGDVISLSVFQTGQVFMNLGVAWQWFNAFSVIVQWSWRQKYAIWSPLRSQLIMVLCTTHSSCHVALCPLTVVRVQSPQCANHVSDWQSCCSLESWPTLTLGNRTVAIHAQWSIVILQRGVQHTTTENNVPLLCVALQPLYQPVLIASLSDIDALSWPIASHPGAQGTFWRHTHLTFT